MSGNAPVPPPPPHSEPAQQPPVFQPRAQRPTPPPSAQDQQATAYQQAQPAHPAYGQDQQATAYQPVQPAHPAYGQDQQATAYQPAQPAYQPPAYQQPAYQPPPPAFAPGSGQQPGYAAPQQPAPQQPAPQQQYAAQQPAPQQYAPQPQYAPQQAYQPAYTEQPQPAPPGGSGSGQGGRPGKSRRGLSPGWIAFIAVDVILVGIVIAFAINLAGGSDGAPPSEGPGTSAEAPAAEQPEAPAEEPGPAVITGESVTSPSKNITCTISEDGVSCGIAELATQPAAVDGCKGTKGYVATLTGDGVDIPCVPSADQPKKAGNDVPVLEYDQSKEVGSYSCTSSKTGMRCTDSETGKGFNLAKAGLSSF
ncbi:hypothetical protein H9623_14200 [Oerskovia sp. Sa1BUA8]|uniref:Uncharacterized protein n=1 Tax=Oerskovia douganii TaxID=2762210 RepID=A0A9D5UB31_9CELL|nr:hypothetical protein [Oerskovia douganii]MBE7701443.1 hypothetical protein [Oerskovia douganii]